MAFAFDRPNLYDYDIYPKVIPAGKETLITVRPLGARRQFQPGQSYTAVVKAMTGGKPEYFPSTSEYVSVDVKCNCDGTLSLTHTFTKEQEYFIDIQYVNHKGANAVERFSVYCVKDDLVGAYPFCTMRLHICGFPGFGMDKSCCSSSSRKRTAKCAGTVSAQPSSAAPI